MSAHFRFLGCSLFGLLFFLLPLPIEGRFTVLFDVAVQILISTAPVAVGIYCLGLILAGAAASVREREKAPGIALVRVTAVPLAVVYFFDWGPAVLRDPSVRNLLWSTLAFSVGVIIPLGAALVALFVEYGSLEFVGTLMRPVMRPLFRLPGHAALDSLTSWVGSYSVGLYLTRKLLDDGFYSKREAFVIVTCFSTVSIGFVAVVAQTLELLRLFPLVFLSYFVAVYSLAFVFARCGPVRGVADESSKEETVGSSSSWQTAWERALSRARSAPGLLSTLRRGFVDGLLLAASILGSILCVGTVALLLARETPLFDWLGRPLAPLLSVLGLPDASLVAKAILVGITEMYVPALLAREASMPARFFVAVLSISQLVFFSSVGPMMIEMFREIPIRARDLIALFFLRTAILVPALALWVAVLERLGLFR